MSGDVEVVPAPPGPARTGPWGPVATLGLGLVALGGFALAQAAVTVLYVVTTIAGTPEPDIETLATELRSDGRLLSLAEIVAGPVGIALTLLLVRLRRGPSVRDYLALGPAAPVTTIRWLLATVLLGLLLDGLTALTGHPLTPAWMLDVFRTAGNRPLLVFALVVVAPLYEELLFRGFLLEGLRRSRLGDVGSIALVSLAWAAIHTQYDPIYLVQVFALGLLLGAARVRTGSIVPCVLMHALFSGVATVQVLLAAGG